MKLAACVVILHLLLASSKKALQLPLHCIRMCIAFCAPAKRRPPSILAPGPFARFPQMGTHKCVASMKGREMQWHVFSFLSEWVWYIWHSVIS